MKEFIFPVSEEDYGEDYKWIEEHNNGELVRCKDCIHYRYYGLSEGTVSECKIDHCENPDADWFCADGVRKEYRSICKHEDNKP